MPNKINVSKVYLQVAGVAGDGMNLEMCNGTDDGKLSDIGPYPIAWFRADIEGEIKFELGDSNTVVSIPLKELERAIELAKCEVHSEDFYDDQDHAE